MLIAIPGHGFSIQSGPSPVLFPSFSLAMIFGLMPNKGLMGIAVGK